MDKYTLKARVSAGDDSHFFTRETLRFFGDTMANYGVRAKPVTITGYDGAPVECWELYRRRPVKHGLQDSAFFDCQTFSRVHPAQEVAK